MQLTNQTLILEGVGSKVDYKCSLHDGIQARTTPQVNIAVAMQMEVKPDLLSLFVDMMYFIY